VRRLTTIVLVLVAAVCAGCASVPKTAPPEALASYKRIGLVSITVQSFSRVYGGLFGAEREQIDSSSWDIDSRYEQQMAAELSAIGGFEPVQVAYSRSEFARLAYQGQNLDWDALGFQTKDYCAKNQVDAVLVAFMAYGEDFMGNTHQRLGGAGFLASGVTSQGYLYLITIVALVDCKTAKPAAYRGLASAKDGLPGQILRASPAMIAPFEIARAPLKQLTEAQVAALKNNLIELPKKSWSPTLRVLLGR
jgi:hypothetical protein